MDVKDRVVCSESVFTQEIDGEMVLLDMNSENYFGLDEVGTSIWKAIEAEDGKLESVFNVLLEEYDVDEALLKQDLLLFVDRLAESGLVQIVNGKQ